MNDFVDLLDGIAAYRDAAAAYRVKSNAYNKAVDELVAAAQNLDNARQGLFKMIDPDAELPTTTAPGVVLD